MILVFGTSCIDRILRVPNLPKPGGYVEVADEQTFLGGEGANTAVALTTWGNPVRFVANPSGSGSEGSLLQELLRRKGVENLTDSLARDESSAPVCDIYVTPDGERTMFGRGFSRMTFPMRLDQVPFQSGGWFTAEPNLGATARQVAAEAHAKGMQVFLMDFFKEGDPIMPGSYWQCSTDWVAYRRDTAKNLKWVDEWVQRYGCTAILSDGDNGLVAGSPDFRARHFPPFPAPAVVDTTGAGDMLRAGIIHCLHAGEPLRQALAFGSAAGSLKCGTIGAVEDVPTAERIRAHIANFPEVARHYLESG